MVISKSCLALLFILLMSFSLLAQEDLDPQKNSFLRLSTAYSPNSVLFLGKTPNSQTFMLQLHYGWESKWHLKSIPITYLINITPYINYHYPKRDAGSRRDIVTGIGFSPIGFEIQQKLKNKLELLLSTTGGFILTDKKFPTDKGRRLNYAFAISPGLIFIMDKTLSILLGYKFHHISNAQTGSENPGIDSNFIFFSTQFAL